VTHQCDTASLWVDPDRIVQALTNLLGNAVKFSPPGTEVHVTGSIAEDGFVFRVSDEGRGIPAANMESIFERFKQVDASDSRDKGGSGLGLAICRSIATAHGGTIHAESIPGTGSTFHLKLPAGPDRTVLAWLPAPRSAASVEVSGGV
jgi:signal transduction histidine kinase